MTFTVTYFREAISSTNQFLSAIFKLRDTLHNQKLLYRGLSNKAYKLIPSLGREQKYAGKNLILSSAQELNLLRRFRRRAYPHLGRSMTAGEAIFLARHHGLPTRLLDWTANALYALYFACHKDKDLTEPAHLWALYRRSEDKYDLDPFDLAAFESERKLLNSTPSPSVKLLYPFYNSPRLVAQDGVFTLHSDPHVPLEKLAGTPFSVRNLDIEALYCWTIPAASKVRIVEELSGLGITHRAVYPDLDGIAQSLWETVVLWESRSRK